MSKRKNPHVGGLFEDWLKEEGIYEDATNASIKKVVAWQIQQEMQAQNLTRSERIGAQGSAGVGVAYGRNGMYGSSQRAR